MAFAVHHCYAVRTLCHLFLEQVYPGLGGIVAQRFTHRQTDQRLLLFTAHSRGLSQILGSGHIDCHITEDICHTLHVATAIALTVVLHLKNITIIVCIN